MGCLSCGCSTARRKCRNCELLDRAEAQARRDAERDQDQPECPSCGGVTSGADIVCADCRPTGGESA